MIGPLKLLSIRHLIQLRAMQKFFIVLLMQGLSLLTIAQDIGTPDDFARESNDPSKTQREYNELTKTLKKIEDRWKVVIDTLTQVNKRSNVAFQELKGWVLVPYFKEVQETNLNFFDKYRTSYATAYALQYVIPDLTTDSLKLFYNRFPEHVKKSKYGKYILSAIEKRKLGAVGTIAAGFSKKDINGNALNLSDYSGKYVLLDFWGSWCVPCRKGNPHLIETYAKYKDRGLEIIGIAADDEKPDAWRKAVREDKLPWLHVLQGNTPETDIAKKYNIEYYPTKILIAKDGKIIGRYGEESDALDRMLERIFNE